MRSFITLPLNLLPALLVHLQLSAADEVTVAPDPIQYEKWDGAKHLLPAKVPDNMFGMIFQDPGRYIWTKLNNSPGYIAATLCGEIPWVVQSDKQIVPDAFAGDLVCEKFKDGDDQNNNASPQSEESCDTSVKTRGNYQYSYGFWKTWTGTDLAGANGQQLSGTPSCRKDDGDSKGSAYEAMSMLFNNFVPPQGTGGIKRTEICKNIPKVCDFSYSRGYSYIFPESKSPQFQTSMLKDNKTEAVMVMSTMQLRAT